MFDQNSTQQTMGGYQFNGYSQAQQPKVMNYLTPEEIQQLQKKSDVFNLSLTATEDLQARCNHRVPDGSTDSLKFDPETGFATCTICGYKFRPIDPDVSKESIQEAVNQVVDILQTIKILYTDLPVQAAAEYYRIIPLITKIPQLFDFACKNFTKHEYNAWSYNNMSQGGLALFQALQNNFGGGMMQQPQFNPYVAAPQQPVGYPQANPFGYPGASQQMAAPMGYQPQTQGFAYAPQQPVAPAAPAPAVAPAAPAPEAEAKVTTTVNV